MKKNDEFEVIIDGYNAEGAGVARKDGFVFFIPGTIKGEKVLAHVTKLKSSYGYAKAMEIIEPSPSRTVPLCKVCNTCGGCSMWHTYYEEELYYKREKVCSALMKNGIDFAPDNTVSSGKQTGYRNKAQYPVREQNGKICTGFYRQASHTVIEGECVIQPPVFEKIARAVVNVMTKFSVKAYNEQTLSGTVRHIYLRASSDFKSVMLCIVVKGELACKKQFFDLLKVQFPEITTACINYNDRNTNVILGNRYETVYGDGSITDTLLGKKFIISPQAFYQVNHAGCEKLYSLVKEYAQITSNDRVLDLYCGIGTIGLCTADNACELVGVEIVPEAIENAKINAKLNGMENARFFAGDAGEIESIAKGDFDVIIVDPPRKGCDRKTLDFIIGKAPRRLVYVSCDPATLGRDLAILLDNGFKLKKVTPVDMFPKTSHVETVVLLSREKADDYARISVHTKDLKASQEQ